MNLKELDSFRISDAISFHDELNPNLWDGQDLRPEVKDQLLLIAKDFLTELGVDDLDVVDVTVSGSNAAFSYTPHSDLDLHILVDLSKLDNDEIYKELFNAKKTIYNDTHDITIHGVPVELYVQDAREPVVSLGEYSILHDKWLRVPTKRRANLDQTATKSKYEKLQQVINKTLKSKNIVQVNKVLQKIRQYRQAGLDKGGEFGPENLAFKVLRKQGLIKKLYDLRDKLHSEQLTIKEDNPELDKPTPTIRQVAKKHGVSFTDIMDQLVKGVNVELEHTNDETTAREIALDHLNEDPKYYDKLASLNLEESSDSEIHNYPKLDKILSKLCEMVIKGQKSDKDYGMVAACVLDPDNNIVAGLNIPGKNGKRIHAERVAVEKYESKHGKIPEGSIIITTLSPCNESHDETAAGREGESCTDYLNSKGIKKVYCGYIDPTQTNDNRDFNLMETSNKEIREECKKFADTFLKQDIHESENTDLVYHVTPTRNVKRIMQQGLIPQAGDRSQKIAGEDTGVYTFPDLETAESAVMNWLGDEFDEDEPLTMLAINISGLKAVKGADYEIIVKDRIDPSRIKKLNIQLEEASGYIPSEKEKNDPRFKTALTVDVRPDTMKKDAKKYGNKISRAGIPPTLRPSGKF